jgi:hypothetical protein
MTDLSQVTETELHAMTAPQIFEAWQRGRLDSLLAGQDPAVPPPWPPGQLTEADLKTMSPQAIVDAMQAGRLNALLGRPAPARS